MKNLNRLVFLLPSALLLAASGRASAMDPPASDYGTAREAMAAFEKADQITKLDCFHYMAAKALKTPGRDLWEPASYLGRMASDLGKEDELEAFAAEQIAAKDAEWAAAFSGFVADWQADRGAFEKASALLAAVVDGADRYAEPQRQAAASRAATILATKKDAPEEAVSYLAGLLESTFSTNASPVAFCALASQAADLCRTRLGKPAEAEALSRRILAVGPDASVRDFCQAADRLASILSDRGDAAGAADAILAAIDRSVLQQGGAGRRLVDLGASAEQLEKGVALLRARMAEPPKSADEFRGRAERVQPELVALLLALGRPEEAFAEARVLAFLASDQAYPGAAEQVARVLKALDGNLGRANDWLAFQSTAVTNAAEAPAPVLLSIPAASDAVRAAAAKALAGEPVPGDWTARLARARYLLWLDRPAEATEMAASAFAVCPLVDADLQTCATAVTRPMLVATRDEPAAKAIVDWLLAGSGESPFPALRKRLAYPSAAAAATPEE